MTPEEIMEKHKGHFSCIRDWVREIHYAEPVLPGEYMYWIKIQVRTDRENVDYENRLQSFDTVIGQCLLEELTILNDFVEAGVLPIEPTDLEPVLYPALYAK